MKICNLYSGANGYSYCNALKIGYIENTDEGFWVLSKTIKVFLPFLKSLPAGNLLTYQVYPIEKVLSERGMVPKNVRPFWRLIVIEHNKRFFPAELYRQLENRLSELFSSDTIREFEAELLRSYDFETPPAKFLLDYIASIYGNKKGDIYRRLGVSTHMAGFNKLKKFSLRGSYLAVKLFMAKLGLSREFSNRFIRIWEKWINDNCTVTQNCETISIYSNKRHIIHTK